MPLEHAESGHPTMGRLKAISGSPMILRCTTIPLDTFGYSAAAVPIEHALRAVPGVTHVYVNPVTEMAYVRYDQDRCDERTLRAALDDLGHGATPQQWPLAEPGHRHEGRVARLLTIAYRALRRRRSPVTRNLEDREKTP